MGLNKGNPKRSWSRIQVIKSRN